MRTVKTNFAFNGMPKGLVFTYDTEADTGVEKLVVAGMLSDVTAIDVGPETIVLEMPGMDSTERMGEINGEGEDQSPDGGGDDLPAGDTSGDEDVQGNKGTRAKVAKGR